MVFEFIIPYGKSNLAFFTLKIKKEFVQQTGLTIIQAVESFKNKKNNHRYWDRAKLYKQMVKKVCCLEKLSVKDIHFVFV